MAQCPACGALLPARQDCFSCAHCGANINPETLSASPVTGEENSRYQASQPETLQAHDPGIFPTPWLPSDQQVFASATSAAPEQVDAFREFAESTRQQVMPVLAPGEGSTLRAAFPLQPPPAPGLVSTIMPRSGRRRPTLWRTLLLILLQLLLLAGSVFIGIRIGQAHPDIGASAPSTPGPDQFYRQITARSPSYSDSLQNADLSKWSVFEDPTYGCEINSDGLHVYTRDSGKFSFCTSGRGIFTSFAFQAEMTMLTGDGGGLTFHSSTKGANMYYFQVSPTGEYQISLEKNGEATHLGTGSTEDAGVTVNGYRQKHVLTVIAQGSRMYFYIDKVFLITLQDTTYASGYLGLLAYDHIAAAQNVYTNVRIWKL